MPFYFIEGIDNENHLVHFVCEEDAASEKDSDVSEPEINLTYIRELSPAVEDIVAEACRASPDQDVMVFVGEFRKHIVVLLEEGRAMLLQRSNVSGQQEIILNALSKNVRHSYVEQVLECLQDFDDYVIQKIEAGELRKIFAAILAEGIFESRGEVAEMN